MNAPSISIRPAAEPVEYTCKGYFCDEQTQQVFETVFKEANWTNARTYQGGVHEAVRRQAVEDSPEFLIIDLSESEDPRTEISALAEVCEPGITVLAIGTVNDVSLYRDLLASGIQDYLVKPLSQSMVAEAMAYADASLSQDKADAHSGETEKRFCAFVGVRGGVGTTTLATSVAYEVSEAHNLNAAFLDLDVHFGTAALAFDLEPGRGLCDAIENPGRVDSLFIERATIKQSETLSILGAEAPINDQTPCDGNALTHLQSELFASFDFVAVDMPRFLMPTHGHLLSQATDIVLVSDLTLVSARDTIRMLQFFKEVAPKATVHLALNKVSPAATEMSKGDFEQSIERKVDIVLPLDVKATIEASKKGESVLKAAGSCKLSASIKKLADLVSDAGSDANTGGLLKKLGLADMLKSKKNKAA